MTDTQKGVASPCVRNCCLDEEHICLGCFRSFDEICQWSQANEQSRRQILHNAEQRRSQYGQTPATPKTNP